ncbi:pentatricopeptide repeat-containing protein At5g56310-like [Argentina anserina]|uniref:pentatricopeptide repeat-containing protein At5g56310-like n=1 Tax=Argentina anserina TaxID=57926 RepID=UPI0021763014|nr:pentatricopeptide repeat-containing protein At5g56310-like [Potentilla anserina]XP_050368432.1 pentatricopeptide repeat-containing protein At5g56310-like [Potentilla anserina]XP_050368433.1 pentatricopeptide repeat-containing protein At5g56310-like [Potentilla anserina]
MREAISFLVRGCYGLKHIRQAHGLMVTLGFEQDNRLLAQFIEACSSLGFSNYAYSVFIRTPHPDIYLYNTMIKALSPSDAISVYNKIQLAGLRPDTYSIPFLLKAVLRLAAVGIGRQVHCHSIGTGLDSHVTVLTALVHMYSSCGSAYDARRLFDAAAFRDVALWNAMIAGYAKLGDVDSARHLFETMPLNHSNVISWTALIAGYAQVNRPTEAIMVFRRMQLHNVQPDEIAMLAALSACAQLGALRLGEWIHNYIHKHGFRELLSLNNALIDMYAKSGNIRKALRVFHSTKSKTVITWTTMIAGLALHGLGTQALDMFAQMERAQIAPNDITFVAILSACSHAHLVETGLCYFNIMVSRYRIEPKIVHYGCMVDLLGRAGYLQEAQDLVRQMPFEANAAIWGSLLAASNIHGNDELGEHALQHLITLEPQHSGNYSLLSNTYTALGRRNDSRLLRIVMRDNGVKKMPGMSSIEVNSRVHGFIAGEKSHSKGERIYEVLDKLFMQSTLDGDPQQDCGELLECDE